MFLSAEFVLSCRPIYIVLLQWFEQLCRLLIGEVVGLVLISRKASLSDEEPFLNNRFLTTIVFYLSRCHSKHVNRLNAIFYHCILTVKNIFCRLRNSSNDDIDIGK